MGKFKYIFYLFLLALVNISAKPDSLFSVQELIIKNSNNTDQLIALADSLYKEKEYPLALQTYMDANALMGIQEDQSRKVTVLYNIAITYKNLNNYSLAIDYYQQLIQYYSFVGNHNLIRKAYGEIAVIYQKLGDYKQAYSNRLKALELYESINDAQGVSKSVYNIGTIFFYQGQYGKALEQYKRALKLLENNKNKNGKFNSLAAIGSCYNRIGQHETALVYCQRALDLAHDTENTRSISYAYHNMGEIYTSSKDYKQAKEYFLLALDWKIKAEDKWGEIGTLRYIAELHIEQKQYKKAEEHLKRAMGVAKEINSLPRIAEIYKVCADLNEQSGNYKQSSLYYKEYMLAKDTLLNEQILAHMGDKKMQYEIQQREREISLLRKEKEIQRLNKIILIGAAIGLAFLIFLLFNRYKVQRNAAQTLSKKNQEIEQANVQLNELHQQSIQTNKLLEGQNLKIQKQNKLLQQSNKDLEQFAYVASHDLKEPARMMKSYASILSKSYGHQLDQAGKEFLHYIADGAKRMESLLSDLLEFSRVNSKKLELTPIDVQDIVLIVNSNLSQQLARSHAQFIYDLDAFPTVMANRTLFIQLVQNLVSNAIKFNRPEVTPIVQMTCKKTEYNEYIFAIKDNGIGIAPEDQERIFGMFERLNSKTDYEGTGIGLATCKKIVEKLNGKIWVRSKVGEGTTFYFSLPAIKETTSPVLVEAQTANLS